MQMSIIELKNYFVGDVALTLLMPYFFSGKI